MISIHHKWCELIASGRKTIEVRKTKPKLDAPFKCYIYCTQKKGFVSVLKNNERADGKVIGEFLCDGITELIPISTPSIGVFRYLFASDEFKKAACLDAEGLLNYGKGKTIYGWDILSPKIYDKPKELSAFYRTCPGLNDVGMCLACDKAVGEEHDCGVNGEVHLSRPQSWCYVEELK